MKKFSLIFMAGLALFTASCQKPIGESDLYGLWVDNESGLIRLYLYEDGAFEYQVRSPENTGLLHELSIGQWEFLTNALFEGMDFEEVPNGEGAGIILRGGLVPEDLIVYENLQPFDDELFKLKKTGGTLILESDNFLWKMHKED